MFLFVIYALLVWFFVLKNRRSLRGVFWLAAGIVGLVLVAIFHYRLQAWTTFDIYLPVLQILLYPYTGLVLVVGVFLVSLPRPGCRVCGYDRTDFDEDELCPECGTTAAQAASRVGRREARRRVALRANQQPDPMPGIRLAPGQQDTRTGGEHAERQPETAGEPDRQQHAF